LQTAINTRFTGAARFTLQQSFNVTGARGTILEDFLAVRALDSRNRGRPDLLLASRDAANPNGVRISELDNGSVNTRQPKAMVTVWAGDTRAPAVPYTGFAAGDFDHDGVTDVLVETSNP